MEPTGVTIPSELEARSIHAWIEKNQIKNEKGERIDFYDYPFLYDIYRDKSQHLVVVKCAQCGLSTCECIKNHYDAKHDKMDIIYTLPTDADVVTFVSGKVNRIIANNPCMLADVADKDSIFQKQVGQSMIYFRGTWTNKAAIMITADRLVHDEKDSSKQDVVEDFKARLDGQRSKKQRHVFSHPSVVGHGVDVEWEQSNQREWIVTCGHCKHEQYLSWSTTNSSIMSVDLEKEIYVCKACGGELTDDDRRFGRWKARKGKKGAKYSGYHISQLMAPKISAKQICEKWRLVTQAHQTEEYFYNKVLGLPYASSESKVNEEDILGSVTKEKNPMDARIVIGVDSGIKLRFVVGNRYGVIGFGERDHWEPREPAADDPRSAVTLDESIEGLLKMFPTAIMVIDAGGDIKGTRELQEKYPGRVFLCFYRLDRKSQQIIVWGKDKETGTVVVDRNRMISLVVSEYKDKRVRLFNGTREDYYDYWLHWSHIRRIVEESNVGTPEYTWVRSDRDDYVHAHVYYRVGLDRFGEAGGISQVGMELKPNAYEIRPNMTIAVKDLDMLKIFNKKLEEEEDDDWRNH